MDAEVFSQQIRKFLKKVGINSQQEIERAVQEALRAGDWSSDKPVKATMTLAIPDLDVELKIEEDLRLE